jgi:hypothetical protein
MTATQKYSSANTSINSTKLPASTKHIEWKKFTGKNFLDYGGGKFNNLVNFLQDNFNINCHVYDKFNRNWKENLDALECKPAGIICNNVLNVIEEMEVINSILNHIASFDTVVYFSIYEGNKSGVGKITKSDCYQRNETIKEYVPMIKKYFSFVSVKNGIITASNNLTK